MNSCSLCWSPENSSDHETFPSQEMVSQPRVKTRFVLHYDFVQIKQNGLICDL